MPDQRLSQSVASWAQVWHFPPAPRSLASGRGIEMCRTRAICISCHVNRTNGDRSVMTTMLYIIIACGALSIVYGLVTTRAVLAADAGSPRMQEIAAAIQEGAQAYLARQYTTIAVVGVVIFLLLVYLLGIPQA